ncbi:MAG: S-layer homology domain-containing protein, partial [Butyricicoccus pullicaecorum]|nr:S-layer homology domain-containing protein [Butyricicoccus pullicaecorum]
MLWYWLTMLSDLGIIQGKTDGKYHPEETITRAEACALIARLLTGDPNVSNFGGAQNFTDVVKGSWQDSAIGYCVANGITVGVGNGKFEPNRAINDQEFLTMMVRALGYETPDVKQGYPFSYMTVANAIGLRQDTEMMANTDALRGEDAQVIYNALFVDYAKGAKMINTTHGTSVEKYPTLAESVWGLDRAALGTFSGKDDDEVTLTNCKSHTWVIVGADKEEEGRLLAYPIDDDTTDIYESDVKAVNGTKYVPYSFKYEGDADALKGYQVELWGEGKHGTPTWEKGEGKFVYSDEWNIKAIKTVKGQTKYDYDASKADSKSDNGTIELGESKLELDSAADNAKKVVAKNTTETALTTYLSSTEYNGQKVAKDKDVEAALNIRDGAQYKLMDWDSDGNIDWIVVDEANYFKVESANSKRLTVTSMKSSTKDGDEETQTGAETQTWKLDDLNDEKDYKVKFVAPEDVKEGDILEVTYKTAYDKGEKCEVVTATATVVEAENQELDKVSTKDNLVLTFNGETKQLAQNNDKADTIVPANPSKYIDFDEEELGTEFALYMNRNGFIVYSDYATESSNYMMVLDTDNGSDGARPELGALKILTSDNKVEKNVEVVSDLRIDGSSTSNGYNKSNHSFDETLVVGNVYKYWKDEDGKITKMETAIDFKDGGIKSKDYEYVSKNDRLTLDGKSYALKDANVVFAVKPHNDSDTGDDYIQYSRPGIDDIFVDEDDVLAVKAADIPDIGAKEDTQTHTLDKNSTTISRKSWINDVTARVAIDADKNKDVSAAVLGVNNFNKFNAGSTKVGLVTNVSYDKNDVVSIDVATNGKVETLSSVEKTNFDDVVSVLDYTNKTTTKSYSVGSRTEKIKAGIFDDKNAEGTTLKDYLNKNGAYAEITTNADGKLTGVMFMDTKKDHDGATSGVNEGNVVVGDYYQVSRKVVSDVKEGSWMSVIQGSAIYADEDNFKTMDTKDEQKAADFTSDAAYYLIDGKPTKHTGAYAGTKATVVDGFDGNPDVKAAEASDVRKSDIRN